MVRPPYPGLAPRPTPNAPTSGAEVSPLLATVRICCELAGIQIDSGIATAAPEDGCAKYMDAASVIGYFDAVIDNSAHIIARAGTG